MFWSKKAGPVKFYRRPSFWLRGLGFLALAYIGLGSAAWLGRERLMFHPSAELAATPADYNLNYDDLWLTTADGLKIKAWFIPAAAERDRGQTILFLHGNAGNMASRLDRITIMQRQGFSVLAVDYRGYGQSQGRPSEKGLYLDSRAAWEWLTKTKMKPAEKTIIWGYSLGGGPASWLAAQENEAAGLVLESTFTSATDVAGHYLPWLPVKLIMGQSFDTLSQLPLIKMPLLVIHSPEDLIVPYRFGRQVFESYQGPKTFVELHGSHVEAFAYQWGEPYRRAMARFAESL